MGTPTSRRIVVILCVTAIAGLAGCASPPERDAMTVNTPAAKRHPYSVSVQTPFNSEATATERPNRLKEAIENSIVQSGLFRSVEAKNADYELTVTVTQITRPHFGLDFTVTVEAAWALVKGADRTVAMRKVIKSSHTATVGDAVVGATRGRLALEGATRDNIAQGLQAISELSL
jgi:hypothetical protein